MFPAQDVRVGGRAGPLAIPVHAVELRSRRVAEMGAEGGRARARPCRASSMSRPTASRAASSSTSSIDRAGGGAARRAHPGHRRRARQRLRAAPGFDDLHAAQPVPRDPGGRSAATSAIRTTSSRIYVRGSGGTQVPLVERGEVRARRSRRWSINHQGQFPGRHDLVRPDARAWRWKRATDGRAAGRARAAHAGHHPGRVRRRRQGVQRSPPARSRC